MIYSGPRAVVSESGDTSTREFHNGLSVVTPRPRTRAADLKQVFWIVAFSRDPFACVFRTPAPLAGRYCTAPPLPDFPVLPNSPLGPVVVLCGPLCSLSVFFNVEINVRT